jgi:hypothetical protein
MFRSDSVSASQTLVDDAHRNTVAHADDVRAALTFLVPQESKPRFESAALTGGEPRIHFRTERREVTVHSMRPLVDELSLDRQGFVLLHHETAVDDLHDDQQVDSVYRSEIEQLLRDTTGASRAVIFDFTRRSDRPEGAANPDGLRGPADRAHADYTVHSGPQRARDIFGDDAVERVLAGGGHIVQVNVWRPITGPVRRTPLALADASSVESHNLVATDQVFPDRVGEIYTLTYDAGQRWYWAPRMERDEVILIKGWDSRDGELAKATPHGAFALADQNESMPPRESIEVRAYLLFEG